MQKLNYITGMAPNRNTIIVDGIEFTILSETDTTARVRHPDGEVFDIPLRNENMEIDIAWELDMHEFIERWEQGARDHAAEIAADAQVRDLKLWDT